MSHWSKKTMYYNKIISLSIATFLGLLIVFALFIVIVFQYRNEIYSNDIFGEDYLGLYEQGFLLVGRPNRGEAIMLEDVLYHHPLVPDVERFLLVDEKLYVIGKYYFGSYLENGDTFYYAFNPQTDSKFEYSQDEVAYYTILDLKSRNVLLYHDLLDVPEEYLDYFTLELSNDCFKERTCWQK